MEDGLEASVSKSLASEAVDCPEVRTTHSAQPHEEHVLLQQRSHTTTRVYVCQINIHDDLEQHTWMIARCAASFVGGFDFAYIEVVKDCIYGAYWMIFRNEVTNAWWKKKIIVLSVRFIQYLCHRVDCVFVFALQIYKIFHTKTIAIPLTIKRIAILFQAKLLLTPPKKNRS